jgi:uncharacterized protein involved in exopolysaccharide biosynthesis
MNKNESGSPPSRSPLADETLIRAVIVSGYNDADRDRIDARLVMSFLLKHWLALLTGALLGGAAAVAISYLIPRTYLSEVLTAPAASDTEGGLASLASRYSSLASAVGVDVGLGRGSDPITTKAIAILQSRSFVDQFILDKGLMPLLFPKDHAVEAAKRHTIEDGYRLFTRNILLIKQDNITKLVSIRVEWRDRFLAAEWANELVSRVNGVTRSRAIDDADRSLEFLRAEYEKSDFLSLRQSISSIMESQVNRKMLANTRPNYALEILDPAQPADANKSASPKRILFLVGGAFVGFLAALFSLAARRQRSISG